MVPAHVRAIIRDCVRSVRFDAWPQRWRKAQSFRHFRGDTFRLRLMLCLWQHTFVRGGSRWHQRPRATCIFSAVSCTCFCTQDDNHCVLGMQEPVTYRGWRFFKECSMLRCCLRLLLMTARRCLKRT